MAKDINKRIAAEISWATPPTAAPAPAQPAKPSSSASNARWTLTTNCPPDERRRRAEHAKRAYMLRLRKTQLPYKGRQKVTTSGIPFQC